MLEPWGINWLHGHTTSHQMFIQFWSQLSKSLSSRPRFVFLGTFHLEAQEKYLWDLLELHLLQYTMHVTIAVAACIVTIQKWWTMQEYTTAIAMLAMWEIIDQTRQAECTHPVNASSNLNKARPLVTAFKRDQPGIRIQETQFGILNSEFWIARRSKRIQMCDYLLCKHGGLQAWLEQIYCRDLLFSLRDFYFLLIPVWCVH